MIHLYDPSLHLGRNKAACGVDDTDLEALSPEKFKKLPMKDRCPKCAEELVAFERQELSCMICGQTFETYREAADHQGRHVLIKVSDRKSPPAFVVSMQRFYPEGEAKARHLSRARQELRDYFPGFAFDFIPSRLMLTKDGQNSVLLGEAFVAEYLVVMNHRY